MKRTYQIDKQRALQRFCRYAEEKNVPVQLVFPLAEIVTLVRDGLGHLLRSVGKELIETVMREEVRELVGPASAAQAQRLTYRWGSEQGYCVIDGQKVPLKRPRVRNVNEREIPLGSYELFQRGSLIGDTVWNRIMLGLSTRRYSQVVKQFTEAYGVEKSTISNHFIETSRKKLDELLTRSLAKEHFIAILLDGTYFEREQLMVAMGLTVAGYKIILGLRQGASENATVVGELLSELQNRGIDFQIPRVYVLDGSKALHSAVHRFAGSAALVQRCQVHKIRNVCEHLGENYKYSIKARMQAAYSTHDLSEAARILERLHKELMHRNPSAARSLAEGMEETLTVHRLRTPDRLRKSLGSTNVIESAFSIVEKVCLNVKRWQGGDQKLRWVASALLFAESRFNRVHGHAAIPLLLKEIELAVLKRATRTRHAGVG